MNVTNEMRETVKRLKAENDFPVDFKWWQSDNELYMRLNESTVYAIHISGLVTVYKIGA